MEPDQTSFYLGIFEERSAKLEQNYKSTNFLFVFGANKITVKPSSPTQSLIPPTRLVRVRLGFVGQGQDQGSGIQWEEQEIQWENDWHA